MKKLLLSLLALLVLAAAGGAAFLALKHPAQRPASTERIEATPERLARGAYLGNHVLTCTHCHSTPQTDRYGIPPKPGLRGAGGLCFSEAIGFPGDVCTKNITGDHATGVGAWTDGELLRALREGVDREGNALFNMMPYELYRHLSDEDARAVVAWVRTLPPVANRIPRSRLKVPVNVAIKFIPQPLAGPVAAPDRKDTVAYGRYLTHLASCEECHTPVNERHEALPGKAFSGGQEFHFPWGGSVRSANLTPHATGLGGRTKESFIALFRAWASPEARDTPVEPSQNTPMPWLEFAGMTDEDLGAIWDYLRTVPPLENVVVKRGPKA